MLRLPRGALGPVLPLYIAEPGYWALPDSSGRQWAFIAEALAGLREALARIGQPLIIRSGDALDLLARLHARHGIAGLWSHEEPAILDVRARSGCGAVLPREWYWLDPDAAIRRRSRAERPRSMGPPLRPLHAATGNTAAGGPPSVPGIAPGPIPSSGELGIASDHCPLRQTGAGWRHSAFSAASFRAEAGVTQPGCRVRSRLARVAPGYRPIFLPGHIDA